MERIHPSTSEWKADWRWIPDHLLITLGSAVCLTIVAFFKFFFHLVFPSLSVLGRSMAWGQIPPRDRGRRPMMAMKRTRRLAMMTSPCPWAAREPIRWSFSCWPCVFFNEGRLHVLLYPPHYSWQGLYLLNETIILVVEHGQCRGCYWCC